MTNFQIRMTKECPMPNAECTAGGNCLAGIGCNIKCKDGNEPEYF